MLLDLTTGDIIIGLQPPPPPTLMPVYSSSPVVNGTWRITVDANNQIVFQQLTAGIWVTYFAVNNS